MKRRTEYHMLPGLLLERLCAMGFLLERSIVCRWWSGPFCAEGELCVECGNIGFCMACSYVSEGGLRYCIECDERPGSPIVHQLCLAWKFEGHRILKLIVWYLGAYQSYENGRSVLLYHGLLFWLSALIS